MARLVLCCQNESTNDSNFPFSKTLVYEYYDGLVSGAMCCEKCSIVYKFELLAWDLHHEIRVFSLAVLPFDSFLHIIEICSQNDSPKWPTWIPKWNYISDVERDNAYETVEELLNNTGDIQFIIAYDMPNNTILAISEVKAEEQERVKSWRPWNEDPPGQDWFSYLGLDIE